MGNWMIHNANGSNNSSNGPNQLFLSSFCAIGGVADNHFAFSYFSLTFNSADFPIFIKEHFIYIGVEHESASVNSAHPGESLGNSTKAVERVDKRRVSVKVDRVHVHFYFFYYIQGWVLHEVVICVECNCVPNKIDCVLSKVKFFENLAKLRFTQIQSFCKKI